MDEKNSIKKMWWGIAFGLLFIVAAGAAWLISGGTADTQGLAILIVLGILMIVLTVVKVHAGRRYFIVMALVGVVMVVAGLLGFISGTIPEGSSLITGGFIMAFIGGLWLVRSEDKRIVDERSQKIGSYGTAYSWYITFMAVILLFWLDMLDLLKVQASTILGGLMFLMIGTALFFQWYYNRLGDVY